MASPHSPNDLTRQQLDELDTLLQRMLSLPLNKPDAVPTPALAELPLPEPPEPPPRPPVRPVPRPEPVNWLPAPAEPAATSLPMPTPKPAPAPSGPKRFLGLPNGPEPEPATEYTPRPDDFRTLNDLLPFPIPDGPHPDDSDFDDPIHGGPGHLSGTLRGVDAPATPAGFRSSMPPAGRQSNAPSVAFLTPPPADAPPPPGMPPTDQPPAVMTPPPAASGVGLFTPVSLANRVIEGVLGWCGPLGYWLTRPAVKRLLGVTGLGLMAGSAWWVARGMGWVSWPD